MDIRQLETFISVADNKSFTKASEIHYVTQPTVSNHIGNLEKELDTVLFIRTRRNVTLTKSGQILYTHALNIINAYKNMTMELKSFNNTMEGHLNIYASSVPRKHFLPSILKEFSEDYSNIVYSLINDDSQSVINSLLMGETDFGFVGMKVESPKLEYFEVMRDELVFVCKEANFESTSNENTISIEEFLKAKLILREEGSGTRKLLESKLNEKDLTIRDENIFATIEDPATILQMVSSGLASTVISKYEVESLNEFGMLKYFSIEDLDLHRNFYFVYNKDMQYVPINKVFKNFILDKIGKGHLISESEDK